MLGEGMRTAERAPERSGVGGPHGRARCADPHHSGSLQEPTGPLRWDLLRFTEVGRYPV